MKYSKRKEAVYKANIYYHTELADTYDKTQPHFRQENVAQVRRCIKKLAKITKGKGLLDLGCGSGFIFSLSYSYFKGVYGIDITPVMLKKAAYKVKKKKISNVKLIQAISDNLPFKESSFDIVVAYGFLHHLPSLSRTFKEVYRVLKKGGIFYSDQDPNYYFWQDIKSINYNENISELLDIEKNSIRNITQQVRKVSGRNIDDKTIELAEYLKMKGGFKEDKIKELLYKSGFKKISYEYTWFWQEGKVIKDLSLENALYLENHLRMALPLSRNFFKYIRIIATK